MNGEVGMRNAEWGIKEEENINHGSSRKSTGKEMFRGYF